MWWLSGSAPVALHHHLDWVIRQNYQQYPLWGQIFNKWRLQDMWRVNDVCYYYFNPTELNPCTLYKVSEFVMVKGNFNLVGGDKGIRNTIMVRYTDTEWYIYSQWRELELAGLGVTWIRGGKHSLPPHCWLFVYLSSALGKGGAGLGWAELSWGATQELEFIAGLILNT